MVVNSGVPRCGRFRSAMLWSTQVDHVVVNSGVPHCGRFRSAMLWSTQVDHVVVNSGVPCCGQFRWAVLWSKSSPCFGLDEIENSDPLSLHTHS